MGLEEVTDEAEELRKFESAISTETWEGENYLRLTKDVEDLEKNYPVDRDKIDEYRDRLHRTSTLATHFCQMAYSEDFGNDSINYYKLSERLTTRIEELIKRFYKQFF